MASVPHSDIQATIHSQIYIYVIFVNNSINSKYNFLEYDSRNFSKKKTQWSWTFMVLVIIFKKNNSTNQFY